MSRTATRDRFAPGTRIGDYRIEGELGSEDAGIIYGGTHVVLPRTAAIKVMHASSADLRSIAIQMLREACLLEALCHPGIPRVYECGVLPDKRPWTAFERIEGVTVGANIAAGSLPLVDVVLIVRDVADLLWHAHARGVVHRRLTGDAIVRTPDRAFGICVRHWDDALTLDTGANVAIDARDDVHALGVIAYRALTGCVPDRTVSTAERYPGAPVELTSLVDHMLATESAARPTSHEVRDRARWLAATVEPLTDQSRWTAPVESDPRRTTDDPSGFTVRITRTRTT
ncbi:MAG: hypothetical protein WKG01_25720 [Kofleriaceae bacterium]